MSVCPSERSTHFDEIAGVYDQSLPPHVVEHYLRKRAAFVLGLRSGGSVLDVGCGTGALARRLTSLGFDVTGADPSDGMLEVMRARAPEVRAVRAPGSELPFEPDSFDVVLSVATFHHIAEPKAIRATLAEMTRVVRPGGRIVVWDHNPRNPYWSPLMARVPQDTGEERLIEANELVSGLIAAGAQVLSVEQLGAVPDFTPRAALGAAAALERLFERMPVVSGYAAHNVVVATKVVGIVS
jgi:ubiquinone/menaquinone biosynthesis C-methylase UbiE